MPEATNQPRVPLLDVDSLTVEFRTRAGPVQALRGVSLHIERGEMLGVVGESGSGKSVTAFNVMGILDPAGRATGGSIVYGGIELTGIGEREMRELRGREISMIFQNPRVALNPIRAVGRQIEDVLIRHGLATRHTARAKAIGMLAQVRIARPEERYHAYPFEMSGGMCQRVMIALALACEPQLMIADEPTTGLDVTTQKAVMDLVADLARSRNMATMLITHDLGLAAQYCDRLVVMRNGEVVETAPTAQLFAAPRHPYTIKLIKATPRRHSTLDDLMVAPEELGREPIRVTAAPAPARDVGGPLLEVRDLVKEFPAAGGTGSALFRRLTGRAALPEQPAFRAVDGVSLTIGRGESVGLVGESGCGKSTTSSMIARLLDPTSGEILFEGEPLHGIPANGFAGVPQRRLIQMVFQDPTESLNPRFNAFDAIADPLYRLGGVTRRADAWAKALELAEMVGLPANLLTRFPHQLSGGQKARVGIARAIALRPKLLILDEPTSALDVSVQAVVLNLLARLREELGMSYLFVSHDLNVVRLLCDRVIVMNQGRIVEEGSSRQVLDSPKAAYTQSLVAAIPHLDI